METPVKLIENVLKESPFLSILVLNWNREFLLRTTIYSILATVKLPFELFIIDNNSNDGSRKWIEEISKLHENVKPVLLNENLGGKAFNTVLDKLDPRCEYIYMSENDIEYKPGWDLNLITPFYLFEKLGQISPYSPFPQEDLGEVWGEKKNVLKKEREGITIYLSEENVTTNNMIKKEIIDKGIRWTNIESENSNVRFPADNQFSLDIRNAGYQIAWSDKYQAINWGHNENAWKQDEEYYTENWKAKANYNIDGITSIEKGETEDKNLQFQYWELCQKNNQLEEANKTLRKELDLVKYKNDIGEDQEKLINELINLKKENEHLEYNLKEKNDIAQKIYEIKHKFPFIWKALDKIRGIISK